MKRVLPVFLFVFVLAGVLTLGGVGAAQAEQKPMVVHLVVVSSDISGVNYGIEVPKLQDQFTKLAGGFTALGATHGGSVEELGISAEVNMTYLVAAQKNVAKEIAEYVTEQFKKAPFILVWTAQQYEADE